VRRITCDQLEFDPAESEQALDLAISHTSRYYPDLPSLLAVCGASARVGLSPPLNWAKWDTVLRHLRLYAGLELPHPTQWREAVILCDDWNDVELGIAAGSLFIWYHWTTSA
jgi:hypothetical protein